MDLDNTKDRLIFTGMELFSKYGYEGVSTRQIVEKAKANISAITYYFKGKEGLYNAVIEIVIQKIEENLSYVLPDLSEIDKYNKEEQKEILYKFLVAYIEVLIASGIFENVTLLIFRELTNPSPAFELLYSRIMGKIHTAISKIIANTLDKSENDEEVILLTSAMIGQIIMFRVWKNVILKRLDKKSYDKELVEKIKQILINQFNITLNGWSKL